ncbi:TetR/AcrR family transcriptional regulator [Vallitalea okinawensis]|uniref:TetR/AcrR family transcriptional regulator n=1 Tax=Vallitalea okinawensis TaxID=2078660 RepID=UPI000CFB7CB9|nr:TetR/AcrR family transcriptional regulator [Vallitalea okinawensis]
MGNQFDKTFEHDQALLDAALNEFVDKGYDKASLNNILKEANMSKGSFYYHFKNKEDLYFNLIDILIEKKKVFLAKTMKPEDFTKDIFTIFKTQIRLGMEFSCQYPDINRFSESFIKEKGNEIYKKAMKKHDFQSNDQINQLVKVAYVRGDFREDLPLGFVQNLIGYLFTHVVEMTDMSQSDNYEDGMNYLVDFMKNGLAKK